MRLTRTFDKWNTAFSVPTFLEIKTVSAESILGEGMSGLTR